MPLPPSPAPAKPRATLLLAAPRGFCAGVRRAIEAVREAIRVHGPPVYVRRAIVHNLAVVRELEAEGAVFVEEAREAPPGAVLILSAHGVRPEIAADARGRGLKVYDAVCPLVAKVHREVARHHRAGRAVVLIGHRGHPEIEGTLGFAPEGAVRVIGGVEEVAALGIGRDRPVAYAVQTTFAVSEAERIVAALRARFADLAEPPSGDICYATTNRQAAVEAIAARAEAVIVVGEDFSSNARRLAEVAAADCRSVQLVAGAEAIDWGRVVGAEVIGLTAAASTPESSVAEVVAALGGRFALEVEEVEAARETMVFRPVAIGGAARALP
ncbi:4-hydroxy-3-methylbut-2-enyl diphosphate reductase [Sphingomonas mesophila]|uniref:4-hydroxy-3-methylbut-2-enyl diphosphate reductase n=1 Tax=Sphingomonas mesophila TaxID=2303576 RepID=UPI000E567783|nr:4-hydroxy-3-methylbut-2-enyl diphosphate reductase [Sphingomonas mesophila]